MTSRHLPCQWLSSPADVKEERPAWLPAHLQEVPKHLASNATVNDDHLDASVYVDDGLCTVTPKCRGAVEDMGTLASAFNLEIESSVDFLWD